MKLTRRVLLLPAKECSFDYPVSNLQLAREMFELMKNSKGLGLAAPQCGIRKRVFVMQIDNRVFNCFNPTILEKSLETEVLNEGCLSFPGEECTIERSKEIIVSYADASGITTVETLTGLSARCFQHEFDHLDGITMQQRTQHAKQSRN